MRKTAHKIRKPDLSGGHRKDWIVAVPLESPGLTPLREADLWLAGIDERVPPQVWGEGVSPTHLLFFVESGRMDYVANPSLKWSIGPGQLLIVPAGVSKRLEIRQGVLRGTWFHFHDTSRWAHLRAPRASVHETADSGFMMVCQRQLLDESHRVDPVSIEICQLLSRLMLEYIERELADTATPAQRRIRQVLMQLWDDVSRDLAHPWTVEQLAARLHFSTGHFNRLMRVYHGVNPMKMLGRLRMEHAASLLLHTDFKLDLIASQVGYNSAYAFSDAFFRYSGKRPGAYRRQSV